MTASLDTLPHDIQYMILSYLSKPLSGYALDGVPRTQNLHRQLEEVESSFANILRTHPYQNLAATSKQMRVSVEGFCHHLLNAHAEILGKRKIPQVEDGESWEVLAQKNAYGNLRFRKKKAVGKRKEVDADVELRKSKRVKKTEDGESKDALNEKDVIGVVENKEVTGKRKNTRKRRETYRNVWLRTTHEKCIWCGRRSIRKAVFDMLVYCCFTCDERAYGKKISKTETMEKFRLRPVVWLRPDLVFENTGLRPLTLARRHVSGGLEATYLLEEEVRAMAEYCKEHDPDKEKVRRAARLYEANGRNFLGQRKEMMEDDFGKNYIFWGAAVILSPILSPPVSSDDLDEVKDMEWIERFDRYFSDGYDDLGLWH